MTGAVANVGWPPHSCGHRIPQYVCQPFIVMPMKCLFLSADTHYCEYDGNVIFLNVSTNRYVAIHSGDIGELERGVVGWRTSGRVRSEQLNDTPDVCNILKRLLKLGILTDAKHKGRTPEPTLVTTSGSLFESHVVRTDITVNATVIQRFLRSCLYVALCLKTRNLRSAVRRLSRYRVSETMAHDPGYDALLAAQFLMLRPWIYSAKDACLLDSLVLALFLRRFHVPATLVIGIKMRPFTAHAWVQIGERVVNDHPEIVARYVPILVV